MKGCLLPIPLVNQHSRKIPTEWHTNCQGGKTGRSCLTRLCSAAAAVQLLKFMINSGASVRPETFLADEFNDPDIRRSDSKRIVSFAEVSGADPVGGGNSSYLLTAATQFEGGTEDQPGFKAERVMVRDIPLGEFYSTIEAWLSTGRLANATFGRYNAVPGLPIYRPKQQQVARITTYKRDGGHTLTPSAVLTQSARLDEPETPIIRFNNPSGGHYNYYYVYDLEPIREIEVDPRDDDPSNTELFMLPHVRAIRMPFKKIPTQEMILEKYRKQIWVFERLYTIQTEAQ